MYNLVVVASSHRRTLVVELGVACNNRCIFCYQRNLRKIPAYPKMLDFSQVEAKLKWGIENGFDEVSLTGGEPTIRPDFIEIVKLARRLGFRRVAVTTNGSRFADLRFFRQALEAGITSVGISVHGHTRDLHDGLTNHHGSFDKALQAIENVVNAQRSGIPLRLNTFTLVNKKNAKHLMEIAHLFYRLGVRLMMFQPLILSKSNFFDALPLEMPLSQVVEAVSSVAAEGEKIGFRTKVFNIPVCLFSSCLGGLELPSYGIRTFREQDKGEPGSVSLGDEAGHVRMPNCVECLFLHVCPGLHISLLPQEDLVRICEDSVKVCSFSSLRKRLWLIGTDLLDGSSLARVIRVARHEGFSKILLTHGGLARWHHSLLKSRWLPEDVEVVFVHHGKDPKTSDRIIASCGNDQEIIACIQELVEAQGKLLKGRVGLLVSPTPEARNFLDRQELKVLDGLMPILHIRAEEGSVRYISQFVAHLRQIPFSIGGAVLEAIEPSLVRLPVYPLVALRTMGKVRFNLWDSTQNQCPLLHPFYGVVNWSDPRLSSMSGKDEEKVPIVCRTVGNTPITTRILRSILKTPYTFEPT